MQIHSNSPIPHTMALMCMFFAPSRDRILAALPNLKQLDGAMLTKEEKRLAGHPVSSDEEEEEEEEEERGREKDDVEIEGEICNQYTYMVSILVLCKC